MDHSNDQTIEPLSNSLDNLRLISYRPNRFRLAHYPDGRIVLQGGCPWVQGNIQGVEWRDIPTVQVDESGGEIV